MLLMMGLHESVVVKNLQLNAKRLCLCYDLFNDLCRFLSLRKKCQLNEKKKNTNKSALGIFLEDIYMGLFMA